MSDKNAMIAVVLILILLLTGIVIVGLSLVATSNESDQCPQERDGMQLVIVVVRLASDGVIDCHYAVGSEASDDIR